MKTKTRQGLMAIAAVAMMGAMSLGWAAEPGAKPATKPRGRLPAYYANVVTPDQRQEIYGIQQSYAERIAALQQQLDQLTAERDAAVAGVLTAEQRARVAELAAEAKARRLPATKSEPTASASTEAGNN